jgi:hypothetical protein
MAINPGTTLQTCGIVGMCVNGLFMCVCIWRLIRTLVNAKNRWESRVAVHVTLFIFSIFEFIYLVSIFIEQE